MSESRSIHWILHHYTQQPTGVSDFWERVPPTCHFSRARTGAASHIARGHPWSCKTTCKAAYFQGQCTGQKLPPLQKKTVRNQKSLVQCVRHSYISPSTGKDSQPGWHFRWNPPSMTGKFDSINFIAIDLSAESCWTWWMISWLCQVFDPEFVALVNWKKKNVVHIDLRGFLFCSTQTSTLKTTASLRKIKRRFIASLESRTVHGPPLGKHQCLEGAKVQLKRLPRNPKKKPITI